jgi:transposase
VFIFRSKRADRLKLIFWDGSGLCLVSKRLEAGNFVWPPVQDGAVSLSAAQLRMLFSGMDWTQILARSPPPARRPRRSSVAYQKSVNSMAGVLLLVRTNASRKDGAVDGSKTH